MHCFSKCVTLDSQNDAASYTSMLSFIDVTVFLSELRRTSACLVYIDYINSFFGGRKEGEDSFLWKLKFLLPDFCLEVSVRGRVCAGGTQKREDSLLTSFGELYWACFLSSEPLQMCVTRSRVCLGNNPDGPRTTGKQPLWDGRLAVGLGRLETI